MNRFSFISLLIIVVAELMFLSSCGNEFGPNFSDIQPEECVSDKKDDIVTVFCYKGNFEFEFKVEDGQDGSDGIDGENAILEVIDPCGDYEDGYDEVIFRLSTGDLMSYFETGKRRFLTLLTPGKYITTDNQRCEFEVTDDFEVIY
jgi:hypothetical protein